MAYPTGSVRLSAPVGVGSSSDTFGTHYDYLGIGGYRSVTDQSTMISITPSRRTKGMLVRNNTNGKIYIYISDDGSNDNTVTNAIDSGYSSVTTGWKELQLGSTSSGTLTSITLNEGDQIGINQSGTSTDPIFTFSLSTIPATKGGTGITTYATGDLLYASASNTLSKLTKPSTNSILAMGGAGTPSWLAQTTFEVPLTVSNGLTRTTNNITLGGTITNDTTLTLATYKLRFSSTESSGNSIFDIYSTDTTLFDLKSNGVLPNFFSTRTVAVANSSSVRTMSTTIDTDSLASSSTTFSNNVFNTTVSTLAQAKSTTLYLNDNTITLPQRSGSGSNTAFFGSASGVLSLIRYRLNNSIFVNDTTYSNRTSNLFQVYTTGLGSNLYSTANGANFLSPGIATMSLSNPGQGGMFRVDVGNTSNTQGISAADATLIGSDITISGSTIDVGNIFTIAAYSGQSIALSLSTVAYNSTTQVGVNTVNTYATVNAKGGLAVPAIATVSGNTGSSAVSSAIVGKESRPFSWKINTWTGSASSGTPATYGKATTSYFISKTYPHLSSSTAYYDFRTRWILFQNNPSSTTNNNAYPTEPTWYNVGSNVLDGGSSGKIRALDILAGDYSTDNSTVLGGQVAVGISLGSGEVPSAKVTVGASTTSQASLRLYSGGTPASPVDGDIWYDGTNLKIKIGFTIKTIV